MRKCIHEKLTLIYLNFFTLKRLHKTVYRARHFTIQCLIEIVYWREILWNVPSFVCLRGF